MPEMDAPRALVSRPLVKGNEVLGTRLTQERITVIIIKNYMIEITIAITSNDRPRLSKIKF